MDMSALPSLLIKLAYSGLIVFLSFLIGPKIKRIMKNALKTRPRWAP